MLLILLTNCTSNAETQEETTPEETTPLWVQYEGSEALEKNKKIVLVSGDEEYRSEEALPQLAQILSEQHGFDCTVLFAQNPEKPGIIDPNYGENIPGLEALAEADLVVLFTRFRALPDEQMAHFEQYLTAGKPIIALRTSTHAFEYGKKESAYKHWSNSFRQEGDPWQGGFGRLVLGERWISHHGHHKQQSTRGLIAADAKDHPITNGLEDGDIWGPTDVYGVRLPLPGDALPIILGQVIDRTDPMDDTDPFYGLKPSDSTVATVNSASKEPYNPNDPMMPIAWTKSYQLPDGAVGKSFTSTIGSSTDMVNEGVRRLLVNATYHLLGLEVPARASVALVGDYTPSAYNFHDDEYWASQNLKVADYLK
ncbi:MAG: ThuA domain-containing protein [Saprospiraceae bacterium]